MKSFHNTTNESGNQLQIFTQKAENQDQKILSLMMMYKELSPSDVWKYYNNMPITSVRRALSNLTKKGYLEKTDKKKIGIYGRDEYVWKILY
jgi:predicted HTH transcriptional regulator